MRNLVLPIAVLALAGCGDDTDTRETQAGDVNAVGTTAATGSLKQRVARLEQRVDRIESTAVVVGPEDPSEGSEVPTGAGQNATGNAVGNAVQ